MIISVIVYLNIFYISFYENVRRVVLMRNGLKRFIAGAAAAAISVSIFASISLAISAEETDLTTNILDYSLSLIHISGFCLWYPRLASLPVLWADISAAVGFILSI